MHKAENTSPNVVGFIGFALLVVILAVLPYMLSFSQQEILVLLVINVLVVCSYRLLTLTGEWSLAHAVIMGVGAYASALASKELSLPVPLAMLIGASTAGFLAFLLSFPLFRMKGFYFLIASFAAGEVIRLSWKWSDLTFLFGGPKGLKRIPPFPDFLTIDFYEPVNYYYLCVVVVAVSLLILYRVEKSRIGLTFHAIHWQDKLAESVGVNTFRYRMLAFVISAFFAGLAGALYAHYVGAIAPKRFDVEEMVYILIWAIVGGTATFYGPIIGVVALTVLNEVVLRSLGVDEMRPMFYGAVLIIAILFMPNGLEGLVPKIKNLFTGPPKDENRSLTPSQATE